MYILLSYEMAVDCMLSAGKDANGGQVQNDQYLICFLKK